MKSKTIDVARRNLEIDWLKCINMGRDWLVAYVLILLCWKTLSFPILFWRRRLQSHSFYLYLHLEHHNHGEFVCFNYFELVG